MKLVILRIGQSYSIENPDGSHFIAHSKSLKGIAKEFNNLIAKAEKGNISVLYQDHFWSLDAA